MKYSNFVLLLCELFIKWQLLFLIISEGNNSSSGSGDGGSSSSGI